MSSKRQKRVQYVNDDVDRGCLRMVIYHPMDAVLSDADVAHDLTNAALAFAKPALAGADAALAGADATLAGADATLAGADATRADPGLPADAKLDKKLEKLSGRLERGSRWQQNLSEEEQHLILDQIFTMSPKSPQGASTSVRRRRWESLEDGNNLAKYLLEFLIVSWTCVAKTGEPGSAREADDFLSIELNVSSESAKLLRMACLLVHELTSWILEQDWGAECDDFFALVQCPLSLYVDMARSRSKTLSRAKEIFAEKWWKDTIPKSRSPFSPVLLMAKTSQNYDLEACCKRLSYSESAIQRIKARQEHFALTLYCTPPSKGASGLQGLRNKSPRAFAVLSLLCFISTPEHPIEKWVLETGSTHRTTWSPSGDLVPFDAHDRGLALNVKDLLLKNELHKYLECLTKEEYIRQDGMKITVSAHLFHDIQSSVDFDYWWHQALILACYFFMGCQYTLNFTNIGRSALPNFRRLVTRHVKGGVGLHPRLRTSVIAALSKSTYFSDTSWKREALELSRTIGLESVDDDIEMEYSLRLSYAMRMNGKLDEADQAIHSSMHTNKDLISRLVAIYAMSKQELGSLDEEVKSLGRSNALYGQLLGAKAMNAFERGNFGQAIGILANWQPLPIDPKSVYETRVETKLLHYRALIHMNAGHYEQAKAEFKCALCSLDDLTGLVFDITAYYGDVCCELGQPREAVSKLEPAILETKATSNFARRHHRNLVVSYAEACIQMGRHQQVEDVLQPLSNYYHHNERNLGSYDQSRYTRTLILLAQNVHVQGKDSAAWFEVMGRWKLAASMAAKCDDQNWDFGIICLSIANAALQSELSKEYHQWYRRGCNIFDSKGQFRRRGFGGYWFEFIVKDLPNLELIRQKIEQHKAAMLLLDQSTV